MSKLVIVVPAGRKRCGRALVLGSDGTTRVGPMRVLATASGWAARLHDNEPRDWRKPYGHPPTGTYIVAGSLPPGASPHPKRSRRFGTVGALVLLAVGGDALEARKLGRRYFLLHGGPVDRRRRLRPTFGGFRLHNRALAALFQAINDTNAVGDPVSTVEVVETRSPSWSGRGKRDRAGRLRPKFAPPRPRARPRTRSLKHAALITLGFGVLGRPLKGGRVDRRDFVGLALLAVSSLGVVHCGSAPDAPSPEEPARAQTDKRGPIGPEGPSDAGTGAEVGSGAEAGTKPGAGEGGLGDDGGGPYGGYDTDSGSLGLGSGGSGDYSGYDTSSGSGGVG